MFSKFFGKKKDGFYAQIEDDNQSPQAEAKSTPAASAPATAVVAETAVAPATTTDKKSAKKSASKPVESSPAPVAVLAPVAAPPTITNFATDYLIKPSSNSSRRRPGANMNMFLDLARQVQKPANIK